MSEEMKELIRQTKNNQIPYDTFIKHALYDPIYGYYSKGSKKIGKEGDFYTSSHIHSVFSEVFAEYFCRISKEVDIPLHICEIGSGDGMFAKGVCKQLEQLEVMYTYDMVESSAYHRNAAAINMGKTMNYNLFPTLNEWRNSRSPFWGVIFSNEWLDAQPVKVVSKHQGEMYEIYITLNEENEFVETLQHCSLSLVNWLDEYHYDVEEGSRVEVPVYMESFAEDLSECLHKGVIITVDYGYTHQELKHPSRKVGSLRSYKQHELNHSILNSPGEEDITHHVHWDSWLKHGEEWGINSVQVIKQNEFLMQNGILTKLADHHTLDPFSEEQKRNRAIRSFIMGDQLSNSFDVCIQTKNIERSSSLVSLNKSYPI